MSSEGQSRASRQLWAHHRLPIASLFMSGGSLVGHILFIIAQGHQARARYGDYSGIDLALRVLGLENLVALAALGLALWSCRGLKDPWPVVAVLIAGLGIAWRLIVVV